MVLIEYDERTEPAIVFYFAQLVDLMQFCIRRQVPSSCSAYFRVKGIECSVVENLKIKPMLSDGSSVRQTFRVIGLAMDSKGFVKFEKLSDFVFKSLSSVPLHTSALI